MALALIKTSSLLEEPRLFVLIAKNALRPGDLHRLNEIKTDNLYDNTMHSTMESILCVYIAKECNKDLSQEFRAQRDGKSLLQEECSMLKARVGELEGTMKGGR